jgi:hypothetical protein
MNKLDETLHKIGRNVLAYQRLEIMLKFIISNSKIEGSASGLNTNVLRNKERVSRQTMGVLVGELDALARDEESLNSHPNDEVNSVSISVEVEPTVLEQLKADLKRIVESRNRLIHSELSNLNETSEISMEKLINSLDEQHDKLRPVYESVSKLVKSIDDFYRFMAKNLGKFISQSLDDSPTHTDP